MSEESFANGPRGWQSSRAIWSEEQVNEKLEELMLKAFHRVGSLPRERRLTMRMAALSLGVQKIAKEKLSRGLFP